MKSSNGSIGRRPNLSTQVRAGRRDEFRLLTRQVSAAVFSAMQEVLGPGKELDACRGRARSAVLRVGEVSLMFSFS